MASQTPVCCCGKVHKDRAALILTRAIEMKTEMDEGVARRIASKEEKMFMEKVAFGLLWGVIGDVTKD